MINFNNLMNYLKKLENSPYFYQIYGKSYLNNNLYAFHKGNFDTKQILITASIHAREYISTIVTLNLLNDYNKDLGIYFLPMLNPDGVKLALGDLNLDIDCLNMLLRLNNNSIDFSQWKANARGVDLNVNFDAGYGESKFITKLPCGSGYIGEKANSEIENINLLNFIKEKNICVALSYHTKGEVVYYGFDKLSKDMIKKEKKIGNVISKTLKYRLQRSHGSSGGLSDYLAYKMNIPSFTIELGNDKLNHPIDLPYLNDLYKNQLNMLNKLVEMVGEDS